MGERVIAAIDQGTTSTRCLLFHRSGRMLAVAQREHRQHYPAPGLVEHDPLEIWRNVGRVVPAALRSAGLTPDDIVALGIAHQRGTTVVWDRHSGVPVMRAITWQDTRTDGIVARLVADGHADEITRRCGLAPATYAIAVTGSLVQWFRDSLEMIPTAARIETLAETVPDNGGCYIVPAFSGLYSPRWHPDARGVMVGLTSFVTRGHPARAVPEATAWQTREVVDAMNLDSGVPLTRLKVDGGMTANHLLMQFVADVLDVPVERPLGSEAVSLGAAYAAGLAVGHWADVEVPRTNWHRGAAWEPAMDPDLRRREHGNWGRAVARSYGWVQPEAQ